jgi:hypothetical protein
MVSGGGGGGGGGSVAYPPMTHGLAAADAVRSLAASPRYGRPVPEATSTSLSAFRNLSAYPQRPAAFNLAQASTDGLQALIRTANMGDTDGRPSERVFPSTRMMSDPEAQRFF